MKKILLVLLSIVFSISFANAQTITKPYDFPVKPGTTEWKKFTSKNEKDEACQIPEDILKNLTTEALAKTCLQYPQFKNLYFFNDIQTGFTTLKNSFNGFQELLSRKDAGYELLKIHNTMNPEAIDKNWNDTLKGNFAFTFVSIELLLSQPEIQNNLAEQTKQDLKRNALKKFDDKKIAGDSSYFSLSASMLIVARVLDSENKLTQVKQNNRGIELFLSKGIIIHPNILDTIYNLAK